MSSGAILGTVTCDLCGGTVTVREGKAGTLGAACKGTCGKVVMVRTPVGTAAVRARLGNPAPAAKPAQKKDILADL
jgi:hypothetical protein